jgi:hypothetical protein
MTSPINERQATESKGKVGPSRFRIEKLEERIAPAKGGIPGKPAYHYPPGQTCYYGFCCGPGHSQKGGCDL